VTQWSSKEIKAIGHVIVPVIGVTLSNPLASQMIPFTDALLCVKNFGYFHLVAQYRYHTEATIDYMQNYLAEIHRHKDVFSRFRARTFTKMVLEAFKSSELRTNSSNGRVTPLGTNFLQLQRVVALMKMKYRSSQTLHNILSTNRISTL